MSNTSLLSRERGLKFYFILIFHTTLPSLLSWERGLKCADDVGYKRIYRVAPLVGAWIEIVHQS